MASVSAQDSQIFNLLQEDFGANENLPSIIEGVDAIEAKAERIQYGVEKAAEGFKNVDGIVTAIAGVAGRLDGIDAKLTGKLSLTTQQLEYDLSNAEDEINAKLSNAISQIK